MGQYSEGIKALRAGGTPAGKDPLVVAHTLKADGFDASEDGTGRGVPLVPTTLFQDSEFGVAEYDTAGALRAGRIPEHQMVLAEPIAFALRGREEGAQPEVHDAGDTVGGLRAASGGSSRDYIAFSCKDHAQDAGETAPTLRSMNEVDGHANGGGQIAVAITPLDLRQAARGEKETNNRTDGGPAGTGIGNEGDVAFTVSERGQAVAFQTSQSGTRTAETHATLDANNGSRRHNGVVTGYDIGNGTRTETDALTLLRNLREQVGEEALSGWGLGVLSAIQSSKILQFDVHGDSVRCAPEFVDRLEHDALPCAEDGRARAVLDLWSAGCVGRPPQGWRPHEQLARELNAHLQIVSHSRAQAARFLLGLWEASEGLGVLRETLSALQEIWRPALVQEEPTLAANSISRVGGVGSAVRRLTPRM